MKKISILALALILAAAMLTGCGCRNSNPANTTPTAMPTRPTPAATTAPTTAPTTQPTHPSSAPTIEDGNGPLPTDMTNATAGADGNTNDTTGGAARSGRMPMG